MHLYPCFPFFRTHFLITQLLLMHKPQAFLAFLSFVHVFGHGFEQVRPQHHTPREPSRILHLLYLHSRRKMHFLHIFFTSGAALLERRTHSHGHLLDICARVLMRNDPLSLLVLPVSCKESHTSASRCNPVAGVIKSTHF